MPVLERSQWEPAYVELAPRIEAAIVKREAKGLPTCGHPGPDLRKLSALMAEVGEVARVFQDGESVKRLRDELFDVAVAATLWASALDAPVRPDQRSISPVTSP